MAFELYGMLAGNVSPMTGENVKPAYGGEDEAFLKKVVTPIYDVIARVYTTIFHSFRMLICLCFSFLNFIVSMFRKLQEARKENPSTLSGEIMMI